MATPPCSCPRASRAGCHWSDARARSGSPVPRNRVCVHLDRDVHALVHLDRHLCHRRARRLRSQRAPRRRATISSEQGSSKCCAPHERCASPHAKLLFVSRNTPLCDRAFLDGEPSPSTSGSASESRDWLAGVLHHNDQATAINSNGL